jgi:hypothetical protein
MFVQEERGGLELVIFASLSVIQPTELPLKNKKKTHLSLWIIVNHRDLTIISLFLCGNPNSQTTEINHYYYFLKKKKI